ncbi:asparaginase [Cladophialophora carrionii]|uniref:Asparaginase n=1 Tax=Cladophialophora carrionii TaxID=86049 RepID=A0A1C1C6N3_9EURO|nr:asparaginase [Cladophialophora carrionii]
MTQNTSSLGPFKPTLILHGGAGALSRANLPPELWTRYRASLSRYLTVTRTLLDSGASALDAACHAVTLFEDDVLFNCGRGSVFTERGTIEMEASVMVCSVDPAGASTGRIKRAAAVSLIRNTRHPILLAKEVLLTADEDGGLGGTSTMHCHLSGLDVEEWGWKEKALEKKPDRWFWTRRRWEEHRRGPSHNTSYTFGDLISSVDPLSERVQADEDDLDGVKEIPSQGTVGAVCLDSWGNLAVATSTGGLTNKKAGRIGDTPTVGAGFWAEAWHEDTYNNANNFALGLQPPQQFLFDLRGRAPVLDRVWTHTSNLLGSCLAVAEPEELPPYYQEQGPSPSYRASPAAAHRTYQSPSFPDPHSAETRQPVRQRRRAVAMSGTGNGDSFIRVNACRTAASICRLDYPPAPLTDAVRVIAGQQGQLQRSAGDRWGKTGEGQGGIIGIEVVSEEEPDRIRGDKAGGDLRSKKRRGRVVFDFNCGGLFRAYFEVDENSGTEQPKVMVFKEEY